MICVLGTFLTVCLAPPYHPFHHPLTPTGRSNMVGPSPRQRDALLGLLLASQREAQLSRPRHGARRLSMHLLRRHSAR